MSKLLFLIADTGGGHRAAATAVERQMAVTSPGEFEITILDPFTSATPRVIGGTARTLRPDHQARALAVGRACTTRPTTAQLSPCSTAPCCDP